MNYKKNLTEPLDELEEIIRDVTDYIGSQEKNYLLLKSK